MKIAILDENDIKLIKEKYLELFNKTNEAGIIGEKRFEIINDIIIQVIESSIIGTIEQGFELSQQEIDEMYNDFDELLLRWKSELSESYS